MRIVYGGHWREVPEGWTSIPETEQDLTAPLKQADNSVDVIFTEHVAEHLPFTECIQFFQQAKRVLKPGGIVRTVMPMLDQMVRFDETSELGRNYTKVQVSHYFKGEVIALQELGIDFMQHGKEFMFDSLFKGHNHRHIWSSRLLAAVLTSIGFEINVTVPGSSLWDPETCLERVIRGVDAELAWNLGHNLWDPESIAVEARKPIITI